MSAEKISMLRCFADCGLSPELLQAQFATNFFGPFNLTNAVLPHMRERGKGTLIFVNSTSRWQTFAGVSAYGASKAALDRETAPKLHPVLY